MKNIPFFDYPAILNANKNVLIKIFEEVASKGAFILQEELENFEERLASFTGSNYAVGVGNATDALQLLLRAYGIKENDEILICSHTMIATASAINSLGAKPVPVEAGKDHLIDVSKIEDKITDKTVAIMPTQLNGRIADMDSIAQIAYKNKLAIFEDSAQALGAKYKNTHAGNFGIGGCISFYPAKILGCLGDGGAVLCNDEEIYKSILLLRDHGRDKDGDVPIWGFNSRLDNIQAAFLDFFMDSFEKTIKRRREIASLYNSNLSEIEELHLPPPPDNSINFDVFQNYEIQAESRDDLKAFLSKNGVGTLIQWGGKAIHQFKALGFKDHLPITDLMFSKLLMLPLNLTISNKDVDYICSLIKKFYK